MWKSAAIFLLAALLTACGEPKRSLLQDLSGHDQLTQFTLQSIRGTRDGDRLRAQLMISDSSSILTIEMNFAIGSPTRLEGGTWSWGRQGQLSKGTVTARSVTFLGGQDGPPSIGGTFDLMDANGAAHYRVNLPVTELKARL